MVVKDVCEVLYHGYHLDFMVWSRTDEHGNHVARLIRVARNIKCPDMVTYKWTVSLRKAKSMDPHMPWRLRLYSLSCSIAAIELTVRFMDSAECIVPEIRMSSFTAKRLRTLLVASSNKFDNT